MANNTILLLPRPIDYSPEALKIYQSLGTIYHKEIQEIPSETSVIVTRLEKVSAELIQSLPNLKVVASSTTGEDHIDLEACKRCNVEVISLQGETEFLKDIPATAEHTIGLMLALMRNTPWAFYDVLQGNWDRNRWIGHELKRKILGIIGYGRVGKQVAKYARVFGIGVLSYEKNEPICNLYNILEEADIVSIHISLESNNGFFGKRCFEKMKENSFLINTSRGAVVSGGALLEVLESGKLAGAALDVVQNEPDISPELLEYAKCHQNLLITPHSGGCTRESMEATETFIAQKVKDYLQPNAKNNS